jgi:hypothetical protein
LAQHDRICKTVAASSQYDNLESATREIKLKGHIEGPDDGFPGDEKEKRRISSNPMENAYF